MKTASDIIDLFGGPPEFSRTFAVHIRTIYTWRRRNYIDPEYDVRLVTEANRRGIDLGYECLARLRAPADAVQGA